MSISFVIVILIFFSNSGYGQINPEDKNRYLDADYYFYIKEYGKALDDLLMLHTKYPDHGNINYLIGVCYIFGSNDAKKALPYLEIATKLVSENYRPGDLKSSASPPDTWLFYGDVLHSEQKFDEASLAYHNYLELIKEDEIAKRMAMRRIMGLGISYEGYLRPPQLVINNLGSRFNTEEVEFRPVVSGNGQTMIYTSSKGVSLRIYYSQMQDENWTEPVDITRELGSDGSFYVSSLSYKGDKVFLVKQDKMNSDIYESNLINGTWSKVEALHKRINSAFNESSACVTNDGNRLYFSSDKPGGYGGMDIYYSDLVKGSWGKPINIEAPINTSFDDDFPVISNSGDTLYFSTNGRESIGKMDIFITEKSEENGWSTPKNIGSPYNTVENDYLGMFIKKDKETYVAQVRNDGYGKMDIFHIYQNENEEIAQLPPATKAESYIVSEEENAANDESIEKSDDFQDEKDNMSVANTELQEKTVVKQEKSEVFDIVQKDELSDPRDSQFAEEPSISLFSQENTIIEDKKIEHVTQEHIVEYVEKTNETDITDLSVISSEKKEPEIEAKVPIETTSPSYNQSRSMYTIQLMALRHQKNKNVIRNVELQKVKMSVGNDGYTRYSYGEYNTIKEAQSSLRKLLHDGHGNAFIRETSSIDNY